MPLKNGLFLLKEEVFGGRDWCVIVHGLGEHSGRYEKISKYLLKSNWRSEGKRGDIKSFDDYLEDVEKAVSEVDGRFHLIGHSLGGLIVLYLFRYEKKRPARSYEDYSQVVF